MNKQGLKKYFHFNCSLKYVQVCGGFETLAKNLKLDQRAK